MSLCILAAGLLGTVMAVAEPAQESKDRPHVKLRIVSEHGELVPGTTETLGLVFTMEPHWHIYFNGAPGGGNPPNIDESHLPPGFELGEIQWPGPERYVAPGGIYDSVYTGEVTLLLPLKVPADAKPGEKARVGLKLLWLECSDVCVFGKGEGTIDLPIVAAGSKATLSASAGLIGKARARMPAQFPTDGTMEVALKESTLTILVPGAKRLEFYPGPACSDLEGLPEANLAMAARLLIKLKAPNENLAVADGVLGVWPAGGGEAHYYRVHLEQKPK